MNHPLFQHFGVVGGGAWGTALAQSVRRAGRQVTWWLRDGQLAETIRHTHLNPPYLPGIALDPQLLPTTQLADIAGCAAILLVIPAQQLRGMAMQLRGILPATTPLILCCKGIEVESGLLMADLVASILPGQPIAILSGPSFADEVAKGLPTAITIAAQDVGLAWQCAASIGGDRFRPYPSTDIIGVQIGGAVKNVLAIAAGMVIGKGWGENARAALITRGLAEITTLAVACGALRETLTGLAGLGDILLTCGSPRSRNMALGLAIGQGRLSPAAASSSPATGGVVEGISTAKATLALAKKHNLAMPITQCVYAILHEGADLEQTMQSLLSRPLKAE